MNTGIVNDALALCLNIYNSVPPNDKWTVVNIGRSSFSTFTYQLYPEIPTGFGYNYDNTPKLLTDEGVIEAMTLSKWYTGIGSGNKVSYDFVTSIAIAKGYLNKEQRCSYYWKYKSYGDDFGPKCPGQFAILVNMDALRNFYSKYSPTIAEESSTQNRENPESQKKMIDEALIEEIKDIKLKRICVEINTTPEQNVLSLSQSIGEALKWAVWLKAKQKDTKLKESIGLEALLDEAIVNSYFESNAAIRFLKNFKNNFMKTAFDMVRHDESYVPDLTILNPQIDALEHILRELFKIKKQPE